MRRILVLTLAVLLTSGYFPGPAAAVDTQGPACANIKTGSGTYQVRPGPGPSGDAAFHFEFTIATAPCDFVTYYLFISDSNGGSRTATYPATPGNDALALCGTTRFCYDHSYGSTTASPPPPTVLTLTGETKIHTHTADTAPPLQFVLCDANPTDPTYPDCPSPDNPWDQ